MAKSKKDSGKKLSYRGEDLLKGADVTFDGTSRRKAEARIDRFITDKKLDLARHQVDALVSFYNNVGNAGLVKLTPAITSDRPEEVASIMTTVANEAGSSTERTAAEVDLWNGGNAQLLSPKLRMIANGDDEVNGYRALFASSVSSTEQKPTTDLNEAMVHDLEEPDADDAPVGAAANGAVEASDEGDRGLRLARKATVSCFVHLEPGAGGANGSATSTPDGTIEVHQLAITDLEKIRHGQANKIKEDGKVKIDGKIAYVETGSPIAAPKPRIGASLSKPPKGSTAVAAQGPTGSAAQNGTPPAVIVGIIDVGGFDFAHQDFQADHRRRSSSRFLALWDQGLVDETEPGEADIHPWNRELAVPNLEAVDDLEELFGIGPETKKKLAEEGVRSQAELSLVCDADLEAIADRHGLAADELQEWSEKAARNANKLTVPFGALFAHQEFDQAIRNAEAFGLEASDFLTQTIEQPGAHATHVAGIAAGNTGICPEAWIVGVTIAMGDEDVERRASFYDSTRLGQAVDFITQVAKAAGLPVSINISLGTNGHAHDGTSPINKWIETTLREQGRVICVAAGNSGKETASYEGDIGFMSGRIHSSGQITAKDLVVELGWQVVGNGIVDVSENEMEIWYNPGDEFAVQVRAPSGEESEWVKPGAFLENWRTEHDTFVSVYSERFLRANGANRISVFLSPKYKGQIVGVEPGVWQVRLRGERIRDGRYNAWIERDDFRPVGRIGESDAWMCPSFFTLDSNEDNSSINSLGCSGTVIAVANAEGRGDRINPTSSQGPTRDGRSKPDIAAPGTDIVAARGFARRSEPWITMTGTSMASPFVAGVAANMLIREPTLTAGQVLGIIHSTAKPLPGSDYAWRNDAGFGVIDERACLRELERVFKQVDAKPSTPSVGN